MRTGIFPNRAIRAIAEKRLERTITRMGPAFLTPGKRFFDIRIKWSKTRKATATWDSETNSIAWIRRGSDRTDT